jgi:Polyketide cyclase / dehydrase and lipid transport
MIRSWQHSAESTAAKEDVWPLYSDVARWSDWSPGVQWARLHGPFEVGMKGKSKPPRSPALRFRLTAVDPGTRFASEARLPGARLFFEHHIEDLEPGARITHQVTLSGPLSFLYLPSVRRSTEQALIDGVDRLAELAASER